MAIAPNFEWDHLRVFLAVMRSQNLREAGKALGVSHPTIRRRLQSLEADFGVELFERKREGLVATEAAGELVKMAEEVEASIFNLGRKMAGAETGLSGPIRVTAPDVLAHEVLAPIVTDFMQAHPQIEIDLHHSYDVADLGNREADIAIRGTPVGRAPRGGLTGRKAITSYKAVYGKGEQWIGYWGEERDRAWVKKTPFPDLPIRGAFPDPQMQKRLCQAGLGLSLMSCFVAGDDLSPITKPVPDLDLWVLVHPDLKRNPRLRLFRDAVFDGLRKMRPLLQGRPG
jgi:DNA-binding transcriptional LysR family regulator